jgi:PAS domain S-box-containing protein
MDQVDQIEQYNEQIESLREANEALRDSLRQVTAFQQLSNVISTTLEHDKIVELLLDLTSEIIEYRGIVFLLYDSTNRELTIDVKRNASESLLDAIDRDQEEDIMSWVLDNGSPVILPASEDEDDGSHILVPLSVGGRGVAMLYLDTELGESNYVSQHFEMLSLLANQAAAAIQNARHVESAEAFGRFLRHCLNSMQDGVLVLSGGDRISLLNLHARIMLRLSDEGLENASLKEVIPADLLPSLETQIMDTVVGMAPTVRECEIDLGGFKIPIAISISSIVTPGGKMDGFICVMRDMTQTRQLDQLRELDDVKNEFVSNVSHELRTPLTSIKAYTETLLDLVDDDDVETQREFLSIINEECDRLTRLISAMLNLSRMEKGKLDFSFSESDLLKLARRVVDACSVDAENHSVVLEAPDALTLFEFDSDKMQQVFYNIIGNAVKYSPEGGQVKVMIQPNDADVNVEISDEGLGLSPEDLEMVFEKFYRVKSDSTAEIGGTGLGLPITKYIVESHGGKIWVTSEVGKGSSFHFTLPFDRHEKPRINS